MSVLPDPEWPDEYHLLQSPWDHRVHAFPALGEIHSEAICTHTAITDRLIEPLPQARFCLACLLVQAEMLWRTP
jgi:hypothetical protein